jgi:hypothetical protein
MRKPLYFDGDPDLITRTKALFSTTSRLQVRYSTPDAQHHSLRRERAHVRLATTALNTSQPAAQNNDIAWG